MKHSQILMPANFLFKFYCWVYIELFCTDCYSIAGGNIYWTFNGIFFARSVEYFIILRLSWESTKKASYIGQHHCKEKEKTQTLWSTQTVWTVWYSKTSFLPVPSDQNLELTTSACVFISLSFQVLYLSIGVIALYKIYISYI